jgi:AraC family transcriptional activator of tynA and feaB
MEPFSFCVGRRAVTGGAREFQSRFNEKFGTRFRLAPNGGALVAKVTAHSSGSLHLADLRSSSQTISLLPGLPVSPGEQRFVLTLQVEGTSTVRQHDREARAVPGDLFIVDACRPFQVTTTKVILQSIYLDAGALREALPAVDRCTAVTIPTSRGAERIARAVVEQLFCTVHEVDEESALRIARMLPHALSVAFGSHLKIQASWSRDDYRREQAKKFALRNLRDVQLDARIIARGVGLSVRHLHEIFASEPDTLMRWVRSERLRRIKDELADPTLVDRSISTIAYGWGFSEPAHFSRAFRNAYGTSPRAFRDGIARERSRSTQGLASTRAPVHSPVIVEEPLDCGSFGAATRLGERSQAHSEMQ